MSGVRVQVTTPHTWVPISCPVIMARAPEKATSTCLPHPSYTSHMAAAVCCRHLASLGPRSRMW